MDLNQINKNKKKEIAISIKKLNKTFKIHTDEKKTARQLFASFFRQGKIKEFQVLKNINIDIYKGEFVGIVGKNGSGKSTLLKIISNIYAPDKGSYLQINGRVVPFLELGVGFNMDLSGRENIFLNGTILGMTRSYLEDKFDDIVSFAELHKFIDEPVKNYSSGMMLRLAFSIAIQAEADIYILDEILAVGDENFQRKSIGIINKLKKEGKTILFVSHSMPAIQQFCSRAILLSESELILDGSPNEIIEKYRKITDDIEESNKEEQKTESAPNRVGDRSAEIVKVEILDENNKSVKLIRTQKKLKVRMHYKLNDQSIKKLLFGVSIFRDDDVYITGTNTKNYKLPITAQQSGVVEYEIETKYLLDGKYFFTVAVFEYDTVRFLDFHSRMYPFEVRMYNEDLGALSIPVKWYVK